MGYLGNIRPKISLASFILRSFNSIMKRFAVEPAGSVRADAAPPA
jgi:hypothetical protein